MVPDWKELRDAAYLAHGGDWLAAAEAWEQLRAHYPNDPEGYIRGITALCEAGRTDEAEFLAASSLRRFADDRQLLIEQALICFYTADWKEARRRCAVLRDRFPTEPVGYIRGAEVSANLGDGLEMLAILESGCDARPEDIELFTRAAEAAESIHFWDRAAAVWSRLRSLTEAQSAVDGELRCLFHAGRFDEIDLVKAEAAKRVSLDVPPSPTAAERATRFESLGGGSNRDDLWGYGCEFGYYQRSLGLEPLHFLRWASIPPAGLLDGLRDGFAAISNPAQMTFLENDDPIWNLVHTQYSIRIDHTGMFKKDFLEERAKRALVTHMSYLRDKFLEDLESGEKVFVYRTFDHVLTDEQVGALAAALKVYGPGQLLYVRLNEDGLFERSVERVSDNLLVGRIDAFAPQEGHRLVPNHGGWDQICELALGLV